MPGSDRFFIVGAQRCGTTYLYHLLARHPEIEMAVPVRPEPKFFLDDTLYAKGLDWYERTYFPGKEGAWLRGEKSTSYLESDAAAERIAQAYPEARIVALLRDPVARAVSHWRFSVENGVETLPLAEALEREEERRDDFDRARFSVSPFAYLRRGRYVDDLERWTRRFPRGRIRVLVHERLVGDREQVAELYRFLRVDAGFVPDGMDEAVNASRTSRGEEDLPPELERRLREAFASPNAALAARFGLDLSAWKGRERTGGRAGWRS